MRAAAPAPKRRLRIDLRLGYDPELRISLKPVVAAVALLGVAFSLIGDGALGPAQWRQTGVFIIQLYALLGFIWMLDARNTWLARWCAVIGLVGLIVRSSSLLRMPSLLHLMALPPALATALISPQAGGVTAVAGTVLLLILPTSADPGAMTSTVLTGIWATLATVYAAYRPVQQRSQRQAEYLQQAQDTMKAARDRRAEYKQALKDLAQANEQLLRLNTLAQRLRHEAESARRAKEEFVAMVSHELRTPLNMITGFCEMIVNGPQVYGRQVPSNVLADLSVVLRNSQHLSKLIDDVLDLSQIETKQAALTKERVDLDGIVEAAVVAVRPLFDSKGLYLRHCSQEGLPPVFCDPTRIRQVVLNLLSNAGRFTERGGVELSVRRERDSVVVSVTDSGSGIPAKDMDRIWLPFQQVEASARRRFGGTGLGLAISKQFIELHGGEIWAESQEGAGTTFSFRLPIDPPVTETPLSRWFSPYLRYEDQVHPARLAASAGRRRYIVLEEGNALQRLLTRYLDGVEVAAAATLPEAADLIEQAPAQALLINLAAAGEALDSLDECTALPPGMPVITCYVPGLRDSAGRLGVADYLVKPVSRELLLATLDRLALEGKTLLLVDDEPDALRLFRRMLISAGRGYRLLRAADGQEGMRILREQRPDAVLLDLVMPNVDGFRFLAEKNLDESLRGIPVVVISARDPMGQPVVSKTLSVTQRDGLSVPRLLACVEAITGILSTPGQPADPGPRERPSG